MFEQLFPSASTSDIVAIVALFLAVLSSFSSFFAAIINNRRALKMKKLDIYADGQRFLLDSLFHKKYSAYNSLMIELGKFVGVTDNSSDAASKLLVAIESARLMASPDVVKVLDSLSDHLKEHSFFTNETFNIINSLAEAMNKDLVSLSRDFSYLTEKKERYIDQIK